MKKINLIGWLSRNSHEKQSPQRFARYAAMLIMLLTLGVGQMWAWTATFRCVPALTFGANWSSGNTCKVKFNADYGWGDADSELSPTGLMYESGGDLYEIYSVTRSDLPGDGVRNLHFERWDGSTWKENQGQYNDWRNCSSWSGSMHYGSWGSYSYKKWDIPANTTIVWDAGSESWTAAQLYIFYDGYNTADDLTRISTTTQFYKKYTNKWEGYAGLCVRKDASWAAQTTNIYTSVTSSTTNVTLFTYQGNKNNGKLNWQKTTDAKKATSGTKVYFDNTNANWGEIWLKYGTQWYNRSSAARATLVTGTANLYVITIPNDCYFEKYYLASGYGWTDYNPINDTHVSERIDYQASNLTSDITYVATGSTSGSSPTVYATTSFSGHTRRLTFGSHTNGQITVHYTDENGDEQTVSSADVSSVDVAQTCNVVITAVPNTGYAPSGLTLNSSSITSGATQTIRADGTIDATFVAETTYNITVSYKHGTRTLHDNRVVAVGVTTPSNISAETIDGFQFSSWSNLTNIKNNTGNTTTNPININSTTAAGSMTCNYTPWTCSLDIVPNEGATGHSSRMAMSYDATAKAYYINRTTASAIERYRFYINSIEYSTSGNTELTINETKVNANTNVTNYAENKPSVYFNDGGNGSNITVWFDYENKEAWVTEQKHTVTISAGSHGSVSPTSVSAGAIKASPTITATADENYHWESWTLPNNGVTIASGSGTPQITINATADSKIVTANFAGDQYTITYKDQGNVAFSGSHVDSPTAHPTSHTYGTATTLNSATKTGYDFDGWYTTSNCASGTDVTSIGATDETANFTLYAKWTAKEYSTDNNIKNADGSNAGTYTATYDATSIALNSTPSKTGYNITNYYKENTFTTLIANTDLSLTSATTTYTSDGKWKCTSAPDLYVKWTPKTYTAVDNLDKNGGDSHGKYTATYDATSIAINTTPAKTGYHVEGYYDDNKYSNKVATDAGALQASTVYTDESSHWTNDGNVTLYTKWTANKYTVTLNPGTGGSGSGTMEIYYDAARYDTWLHDITQTGYHIAGWYGNGEQLKVLNADGTFAASSVSGYITSNKWTKAANCELQAWWDPNGYTVTLDKQTEAEGYSASGTVGNQDVAYNTILPSITGTAPTAVNGYAFMGFFTEAAGAGVKLINANLTWVASVDGYTDEDAKWILADDVTLYAYYKKAVITGIALSSGTVEPSGEVTATATIEPTPTGDTHIDWKLLYNNNAEYSPQPSEFSSTARIVEFTAPDASGTYKVQAQLRKGTTANAGDLLSERTTSFVVAGTHTVTIQYKCDGVNVKAATVVEGVKPLDWSETITPGDEPFGYTFARWEASDGVSITDDDGTSTKTTTTSSSIKIKAIYDGRLTAVYTKKNIIYFKNTLGWSDVYAHFLGSSYWDTSNGTGNNGRTDRNKQMTRLGETDIWYFDYGAASITPNDYLVFTDRSYDNWSVFHEPDISTKPAAPVVYPIIRDNTEKNGQGYGFNTGTPMFVPVTQDGIKKYNNKAIYFNNGYWRAYDPTTGESGSTGYTLKIYNQTEGNSSRELLQSIPFTNADASGQIFKASINLEAAKGYGIKVERDNSLMYTNTTGHLHQTGNVEALSVNPDNHAAIWIKSTAAGDYDFIITCNGSGQLCLQATFPAAENDYRVLYTDNATWSNGAHTHESWVHPSRVISAEAGAKDIISFFVSKDNSPEYKIQKVNTIDEGSGAITWTDVTSWNPISVDATGVYNFIFNQPSAGFISLSKTEAYTGNFYIRTDNAGSTKWENYRAEDHQMTYSEYAAKVSHADESMDFTHYFMKYVDKDIESGKYKNVKFTVANDYSPCISDTLVRQAGDITPNNVDANGNLQASANIRFMWNIKNNKLQRAYLSPAQTDGSKFLVLQGQATKLLAPDGTALSDENGNNHNGGTDAIQFTDKENWMYEANVKAVPGGRVKLYAVFHESTFYYYGDDDASFNDSHAIELIGGTGEAQRIRVVYDFKTDRLMAAWVPSDGDISAPQTINADIMLIREHQNAGKQINLVETGSISTDKTVYGVLRFNRWTLNNKSTTNTGTTESPVHAVLPVGEQKSQYERFNYMISFPFDVQVGEIFGFGTIGRHYRIYYYDGLGRAQEGFFAERGDDNWRMIDDTDSILHANQGYLLQLNYIRMADDNTETWPQANMNEVELYFPAMNEINIIELEDVEIPALGDAYKCKINLQPIYEAQENPKADEADRRIKDSYWRCIGVPGFTSYEANAGTWENFNWKAETEKLSYLYEWHMDDNKLSVVSSSTFTFKPMHAYLIQNGNSFTWTSVAHPIVAAPRRSAAEEGFYEFYLEMQNGEQALDHTYVRLTDKENITADFDFGQDLSKELNSGANIFTKVGYERLAANNLPLSEQTTIIPVGVTTAEEGYYTFSMPEGTHGIGVTLVDNETGDRTNLSLFDYSVNLTKGDYANRFILEISPIQQMPTNIDNVQGESAQSAKARKVMIDGILYIVKDGKVFDAQGKRLQ